MNSKHARLKFACYSSSLSMSAVCNLSPILFLTFREVYGISYSLLGLLVLINFVTQLIIDLIFSFFSHRFNIAKTVKSMPVITAIGLLLYALWPTLFPDTAYVGLVVGTVVFSVSAGLGEVLISPVIAAIPSPDPDREMSKLHSVYAWGVVGVVILSTLFLQVFGAQNWQWLAVIFAVLPILSATLFAGSQIPQMETPERVSGAVGLLKSGGIWLCVIGIFLGGASECTMAQWSSGYIERALGVPKVWGDIFGVAIFSVMLGLGRTLYSKIGKNIERVLVFGAVGATVCYLLSAVSDIAAVGLVACALTGLCTSMMWPGTLIVASNRFPAGGVFVYALMAAGGDLGASVAPQLVGVITDTVMASERFSALATVIQITPEQLGMKLGMLFAMFFPLAAIAIYSTFFKFKKKLK